MKVLLAIDNSSFSEAATQFLARHFRSSEAELLVLHATGSLTENDLNYNWAPKLDWEGVQNAESLVSSAGDALRQVGFNVATQILGGDPRLRIVESSNAWSADVIVVGSHGRTGLGRLLLGSVSETIARTAPCSVIIVRPRHGVPLAISDAEESNMKILLAIDDSRTFSDAVAQAIIRQFRPEGVQVCIMHVVEPKLAMSDGEMCFRLEQGKELVTRVAHPLISSGFRVLTAVEDGDPRATIVDHAANWRADLVVVGSHGRTGLDRLLIGSVSENVARHSNCSVEIVRSAVAMVAARSVAHAVSPATL